MEIKVTYQGVEKGVIDFQVLSTIALMRKLGYSSFHVRSKVARYEAFAYFKNEDTDEYISFFPDGSFIKYDDCKFSLDELNTIKYILDNEIHYHSNEEESKQYEEESE